MSKRASADTAEDSPTDSPVSDATSEESRLTRWINFRREVARAPARWRDAARTATLARQIDDYTYEVDDPHGPRYRCVLARADSGFFGTCECDSFTTEDGPCIHLNTVRKRGFLGDATLHPIDYPDAPDVSDPRGKSERFGGSR